MMQHPIAPFFFDDGGNILSFGGFVNCKKPPPHYLKGKGS
jgi:hypothetical protein